MPATLGHYKLGDSISSDAVAETCRATDTTLGRTVTVKILSRAVTDEGTLRDRILDAAKKALQLSHPNIAELFELGEHDGRHYLVYEHTAGQTLRATIAGSPLNVRLVVELAVQLADALAEAHSRNIVHGAIRPDSIAVTAKGRAKILDFGFPSTPARLRLGGRPAGPGSAAPRGSHPPPFAAFSPDDVEWMSPEQVLGEQSDERTDIFSLGSVLFEMLTGTQPFAAATGADTAVAILSRTPPPPSQMNASVPAALDRVVMRCLAKSLDGRYGSAAAVAAELRELSVQMEIQEAEDVKAPASPRPVRRRSRLPLVLVVLILVVLAVLVLSR